MKEKTEQYLELLCYNIFIAAVSFLYFFNLSENARLFFILVIASTFVYTVPRIIKFLWSGFN